MKKQVGLTVAALMLVLVGCSNGDGETGTDTNTSNGEQTTITLTGWQSSPTEQRYLEDTIAAFEDANPDINVEISTIADQYMNILRTRLIGGEGPDVFFLEAFEAPGLIETGVVEPLDDYITDEFDLDDFEQPLVDAFRNNDGVLYGLPKDTSTLALFYNKEMFEEAGIEEAPTTWDELIEVAEQLQSDDVYGFGVVPDLARLMFIAESNGGQIAVDNEAAFADPAVVDALQPIVDMRNELGIAGEPSEAGTDNGGEMFALERTAMIIEGNWTVPYLDENFPDVNYGVAEIPTVNDEQGTMAYTVSYVMNAASEKKEASWRLIEYLTGKEGMEKWTSSGLTLPTRASVSESLDYADDPLYGPFVAGASYATVWNDDTNLPIIYNNFNNQFLSAFLGQRDLQEALQEAQDVANNEID